MPCGDTSAKITLFLDYDENLINFDFSKMTCGKNIGEGGSYKSYSLGRNIYDILQTEFWDVAEKLKVHDPEGQFLLYLEWDAVRTSIAQYLGANEEIDFARYKILNIEYENGKCEISQITSPPSSMPKKIPCCTKKVLKKSKAS